MVVGLAPTPRRLAEPTGAEAIVDYEDADDVAAFLAAAFSDEAANDEFIAVINDGSTASAKAAYVYFVDNDNDTNVALSGADVTLIGIIYSDGVLTTANVDAL